MTTSTALQILLLRQAVNDSVSESGGGPLVTASTVATYASLADAHDGARDLLHQMLNLGYHLRGGMVGAARSGDGLWRGELVEIFLAPVERIPVHQAPVEGVAA